MFPVNLMEQLKNKTNDMTPSWLSQLETTYSLWIYPIRIWMQHDHIVFVNQTDNNT